MPELTANFGAQIEAMVSLVENMARALVDSPDEVSVKAAAEQDQTAILLTVAAADLGKVIGKQGRTARSMRTILGAASMKAHHRFSLDIQEIKITQTPATLPVD